MNNHLKGLLVGAFALLIALLLLSKCHSCIDRHQTAYEEPPVIVDEELPPAPEPEPPAEEPDSVFNANDYGGNGVLKVTMAWEFPSDIDLHVIEPTGNEIYFGNRRSSTSGWLDTDNLEGGSPGEPAVENVFWETAPEGEYTVRVKYFGTREGGRHGGPVLVVIQINGEESRFNINLSHQGEEVTVHRFRYQNP